MGPSCRYLRGALAALAGLALGCGEELGPEPMPTARAAGRVRVGDRPVRGGWVEFLPVDGTVGLLRSAPVNPDGTFADDRVAVGTVAIRLVDPTAEAPLPGGRLFQQGYLIRRSIPPRGTDALDIDLRHELIDAISGQGRHPG
jgi:hypothetical protein